jgi:hypothetical protein
MNLKELDSFKLSDAVTFHDHLNPALWAGHRLKPAIKEQLLIIAKDFLEELGVDDLDVVDITISGSNAAYSYTKHSDLDLHILVDTSKLNNDEIYKELFNAKKTLYNDSHHITINNVPVELYVQDASEPVVSLGEYSILHDDWLRLPTKRRANFDQTATKEKYAKLQKLIEVALLSKDIHKVQAVLKTIKRYRQAGLDRGGEFGPENLAFKALRSQGYITKLYALRDKLHSEVLTIENMYQYPVKVQRDKLEEKLSKEFEDYHPVDPTYNVNEGFDQPYPFTWEKGDHGDLDALAKLPDGSPLSIMFNQQQDDDGDEITQVEFYRNNSQEVTGEGDAQRIFATVLSAIQTYVKKYKPVRLTFSASKQVDPSTYYEPDEPQPNPESRAKLYDRLVQRYAKAWGYRAFRADNGDLVIYELSRIKPAVAKEDTMQYASEKTSDINPYGGQRDRQYRGAISEAPVIGNYADLYHTTWLLQGALDSILQSGKLAPGQNKWLSLTRDSRLDYAKMMGQFAEFVIDQNKLRQRFKLDQYDDFKGRGDDEAEERVNVPIPLKGYVKSIHLPASWKHDEKAMQYYEPKLKQYGIPFYYDTMGSPEDRNADVPRLEESSGYIPSEKEKNDPRFKTALTVDVKPDSIKKNAKAFSWLTDRAGIPPTANPNGKF